MTYIYKKTSEFEDIIKKIKLAIGKPLGHSRFDGETLELSFDEDLSPAQEIAINKVLSNFRFVKKKAWKREQDNL